MRNNLYTSLLLLKNASRHWLLAALLTAGLSSFAQNLNNPNRPGPLGTFVNALSGNLFIPRTDIVIPARGFDINIRFSYNSYLLRENYGYGKGWSFHYNIKYAEDTVAGRKLILWGDGREDKYDSLAGGAYKSPRGFFTKLVQYSTGKLRLTEKDSTTYFFDDPSHKKITRMQDPNGNYIQFNYTGSLLSSLVNNAGQSISFTYDGAGRLASVVDAVASPTRTFTYTYDAAGNLMEVKDPLGGTNKYTYLVNGPMKTLTDKNNNKLDIIYFPNFSAREIIGCNKRMSFSYDTTQKRTVITDYIDDGANQVTTYTYQIVDNLSWITSMKGNCCGFSLTYEYDDQGNATRIIDANGNAYAYTYDTKGNLLTATDPMGGQSTYTYSPDFNKITSFRDPNKNLYTLEYDSKGNLVKLVTPENQVYTATYNANGDIISSTNPNGAVFTYNYDAFGNPSTVTGPNGYHAALSFDARGNLLSYTDSRGASHSTEYDILNRLKKITDPLNRTSQYGYDAEGNIVSIKNENNETSTLQYDASGRPVKLTGPTGNVMAVDYDAMDNVTRVKDAMGAQTTFGYDTRSRLNKWKDALGNEATNEYDGNGNIISTSLPNGRTIYFTYDKKNKLTKVTDGTGEIASYTYDPAGNVIRYKNGTGAEVSGQYDSRNRLIKMIDPLGNVTSYSYDAEGNISSVTDRNGFTSHYAYDSLNRVKTFTDNNGFVMSLGYDGAGNITQLTDQNGNVTSYTYDELNRRKTMTFPDGSFQQYAYDAKGNLLSRRLTDGTTINYTYDTLNRLATKTLPGGEVYSYTYDKMGRVISASNNSATVQFGYDALGRVTSETADGRTVTYSYNTAGRTQTVTYPDGSKVVKEFDTRNRVSRVLKDSVVVAEYAYNNADQLTAKRLGNGVQTALQYDIANRLVNLTTAGGAIQQLTYTYDKEGNKKTISRLNTPAQNESFTYDNSYRLTNHQRGTLQNTYSYDAVGNRITANLNGANNSYTVNNLNQLTSRNGVSFTYDGRGNLTYDGQFFKTYDAEGRLTKDSSSPTSVLTYAYDAMGRRVVKSINGNPFRYTYSGAEQIEERNAANMVINQTVFTDFLSPVLNEKGGNKFFYHQNDLMSVEAITNNSGRLLESYRYDVYGRLERYDSLNNPLSSSLAGNRVGFTGQEWDSATNSYRFFYRNYSPELGTFQQRDLIEYEDGMAMYRYVGNNPANGVDIWGLETKCVEKTKTDYLSYYDTYSDTKSWAEVTVKTIWGAELPPGVSVPLTFIGMPVDLYKTGQSIENMADSKTTEMQVMHAGDAFKNGTNAALGGIALTAAAAGPAGAPVAAVAAGTGATIFVVDKTSQAAFDYYWNSNALAIENAAMLNSYDAEKWRRAEMLKEWKIKRHQQRISRSKKCPPTPPGGTQKPPPGPGGGGNGGSTTWVQPIDPNEIIGPDGIPEKKWVSVKDRMSYTIRCENDTAATAPARYIRFSTPIHAKHDAATFELGSFGFNNQTFDIPQGLTSYYQRLDCRDSMGLYVDVVAGYDQMTNEAFWEFRGIDPVTLLPSEDPEKGILFLQDTAQPLYGHGYVTFSIKPKAGAQTLDTTAASASIVFDENEPIATNVWVNTIDAAAPTSAMLAGLPASISALTISLQYSAADDPNGSGFQSADLYVSVNNAPPVLWTTNFKGSDTTFVGLKGNTYTFFASASDKVGNKEQLKNIGSVTIRVGDCIGSDFVFTANLSGTSYQWQVDDGTGFVNLANNTTYEGVNNQTLVVKATSGPMAGYRYRAVVNGQFSQTDTLKFVNYWLGAVSDAWEDAANWSCNSVPDQYTDVIIEGEKPRYPVVNSNPTIRTLKTATGSSLTIRNGYNLTILK